MPATILVMADITVPCDFLATADITVPCDSHVGSTLQEGAHLIAMLNLTVQETQPTFRLPGSFLLLAIFSYSFLNPKLNQNTIFPPKRK